MEEEDRGLREALERSRDVNAAARGGGARARRGVVVNRDVAVEGLDDDEAVGGGLLGAGLGDEALEVLVLGLGTRDCGGICTRRKTKRV